MQTKYISKKVYNNRKNSRRRFIIIFVLVVSIILIGLYIKYELFGNDLFVTKAEQPNNETITNTNNKKYSNNNNKNNYNKKQAYQDNKYK